MSVLHCPVCNTAAHDVDELPLHLIVACEGCAHVLRPALATKPAPVVLPPIPAAPPVPLVPASPATPTSPPPSRSLLPLGLAAAAVVLLLAAAGGVYWAVTQQPAPTEASQAAVPTDTPPTTRDERAVEWVRGCVLVEVTRGGGKTVVGCGWLTDRERKLVFTAAHLVDGATAIRVHFPTTDTAGRVFADPSRYLAAANGLRATVEVADTGTSNGVAVLKVSGPLPVGVPAVPLASGVTPLKADESVSVVGAVGGQLWRSSPGVARTDATPQVVKVPTGDGDATHTVEARLREVQADAVPEDCGGPVVNAGGLAVGLVIARGTQSEKALLVADLSELRAALAKAIGESSPVPNVSLTDLPLDKLVALAKAGRTADERVRAAEELARRGEEAKDAVPDLVDILAAERNGRVADALADALDGVGPPPEGKEGALGKAVRSDNRRLWLYALRHFATVPAEGDALAAVVKLTRGGPGAADNEVRIVAVRAVGKAGHAAARKADAFEPLLDAAKAPDPKLAEAAAEVFEGFARAPAFGKADIPLLQTAVKSSNRRVVRAAVVASRGLGGSAEEVFALCPLELLKGDDADFLAAVIPALARWPLADWPVGYWDAAFGQLTHSNKAVRLAVLKAIRDLKANTGVARRVAWLAENDKDAEVKAAALLTFAGLNVPPGELGAKEYADLLRRLLESDNSKAVKAARPTLRRRPGVDDPPDAKVSAEYTALFTRDVGEKVAVIDRLSGLGAAGEPAVPELLALLTDHPSVAVKAAALRAVTKLTPANDAKAKKALAERLLAILGGKAAFAVPLPEECLASAELAKELGPRADTAGEKEVLAATVKLISPAALAALVALGDEAVEPLAELATQPGTTAEVRALAVGGLAKLGAKAQPAAARLVAFAETEPGVRKPFGEAIAVIGGDAAVERIRKCTDFSKDRLLKPEQRDAGRAALRAWAYSVLSEMDLATLSEKGRGECVTRLETAAKYEVDAGCKEVAARGLERQQERLTRLKGK